MIVHFETLQKALDDLGEHGYRITKGGRFISKDGLFTADITKAHGDVVRVYYWWKNNKYSEKRA
jgi:hypothetical protein